MTQTPPQRVRAILRQQPNGEFKLVAYSAIDETWQQFLAYMLDGFYLLATYVATKEGHTEEGEPRQIEIHTDAFKRDIYDMKTNELIYSEQKRETTQ